MGYSGYENYETWAVCLWIDNEEGSYRYWLERAEDAWDDEPDEAYSNEDRSHDARLTLRDEVRAEFTDLRPDAGHASLYHDLLTHALGSVDWFEVADHLLEGADLDGYVPRETVSARAHPRPGRLPGYPGRFRVRSAAKWSNCSRSVRRTQDRGEGQKTAGKGLPAPAIMLLGGS